MQHVQGFEQKKSRQGSLLLDLVGSSGKPVRKPWPGRRHDLKISRWENGEMFWSKVAFHLSSFHQFRGPFPGIRSLVVAIFVFLLLSSTTCASTSTRINSSAPPKQDPLRCRSSSAGRCWLSRWLLKSPRIRFRVVCSRSHRLAVKQKGEIVELPCCEG